MSNPSGTNDTCDDVSATGRGRCAPILLDSGTGEISNGNLIGACIDIPGTVVLKAAYDLCAAIDDDCPSGTECLEVDVFAANPTGSARCLPRCDTRWHVNPYGTTFSCSDLDGDGVSDATTGAFTPTCSSLSRLYNPADNFPTPFGYCAMP